MNKTVSINLGGWFFHIEEEAYQNLDSYLVSIQRYFSAEDAGNEIVEDIEGRIAEMFQEALGKSKRQVIVAGDVRSVIKVMGNPEQFDQMTDSEKTLPADNIGNDSNNNKNGNNKTANHNTSTNDKKQSPKEDNHQSNEAPATPLGQEERHANRRLYRNTDDKIVGGVCSGLSAYFGINDPIWIRLAFALSFFIGYGALVYFLMMVIVPAAKTSAQKLAMKGEPINIENIEKTVREGVSSLQNRIEEFHNSESGRRTNAFFAKTIDRFHEIIPAIGHSGITALKWLGLFVGAVVVFSLVVSLIAALVGILSSLQFLMQFVFSSPLTAIVLAICGILLIGIPITIISYEMIKRIFRLQPDNNRRWIRGMGGLWAASLVTLGALGFSTYQSDFDSIDNNQEIIALQQPPKNTLYIEAAESWDNKSLDHNMEIDGIFFDTQKNQFYIDDVKLDIEKSNNGQFELIKKTHTRGGSEENAKQLTKQIDYQFQQTDSVLHLNTFFLANNSKWRGQEVSLTLRVPVGKSVFFASSSENIIYDIDNVTDTYDGDMIGLSWIMTERGLMLSPNQTIAINSRQNISGNKELPNGVFDREAHQVKAGEIQREFDTEDFDALNISGNFDIRIVKGDQYKVVLTGQEEAINNASVEADGSTLTASCNKSSSPLGLYISLPTLEDVNLSGNNIAQISGFEQDEMRIDLSESCSVQAQLLVENMELSLSGSSALTLTGKAQKTTANLSDATVLAATGFETEEMEADLSGSAQAEVFVSNDLNAQTTAASTLRYKGEPKKLQLDKNGAGNIEAIK